MGVMRRSEARRARHQARGGRVIVGLRRRARRLANSSESAMIFGPSFCQCFQNQTCDVVHHHPPLKESRGSIGHLLGKCHPPPHSLSTKAAIILTPYLPSSSTPLLGPDPWTDRFC